MGINPDIASIIQLFPCTYVMSNAVGIEPMAIQLQAQRFAAELSASAVKAGLAARF